MAAIKTRIDDRLAQTKWRLRNRDRSRYDDAPADLQWIVEALRRDGVVLTDVATVFGDTALFDEASVEAHRRLRAGPSVTAGEARLKDAFLTKLGDASYPVDHVFARLGLHPRPLAIANEYLRMRSTLRALDVWHTRPIEGPAIETQLWHRDGDDVVNLKMFVYFSDVLRPAGPLCFARGTHPYGRYRDLPEGDERARSTDEQLSHAAPESTWILCEGGPGTVVFADTCGYHKQLKPESDERLLLMAHYVSGTTHVIRANTFESADDAQLSDDQFVAVHDRPR